MPRTHIAPNAVHEELKKCMLADGFDFVLDLEKSSGSYLHCARTGKRYLDFFTFFGSLPVGFNHPKLLTKDVQELLGHVATHKPSNSDLYTTHMAEFVKAFREKAMPKSFKYAFFISGGALAVENALKTAFDYKVKRNFAKGATREIGTKIAHFKAAFHGRSGYTLSLTNTLPDKIAYFPKFNWPRFETPGISFPLTKEKLHEVEKEEKRILSQIRWHGEHDGEDIAAIILEPIQAEGGDIHFRKEFLQGLRELCDTYDWLLIFDEVQTGFGLTGKMWAFEHFGVEPDIVCFGKKSQICGIMCRDTIDRVPDNVFHVSSRINSTWGGNLIDMVRSRLYLEIMNEEKMVENAAKQGKKLLSGFEKLEAEFPKLIYNARGRGLMCAFTFKDPAHRGSFLQITREKGLLILPCGPASIRARPPLNISAKEIEEGLGYIKLALSEIR